MEQGNGVATEEWAFYYPGPTWVDGDAMKNLVLFFDGLALLVPDYLAGKPLAHDPPVATGLMEQGLLREITPETVVDAVAAEALATVMTEVITSGALDSLMRGKHTAFHELSMSRLGYYGDSGLAQMIFEELRDRGLARDSEDGSSIPMHPTVRVLILVLLAQILAKQAPHALHLTLSPCTDRPLLVRGLMEFLRLPAVPTVGDVIEADLEEVGVDLSAIPIEDVLAFRTENRRAYRQYRQALRRFVREVAQLPPEERTLELRDRREDLRDQAADLRRRASARWRKPLRFALGVGGSVLAVVNPPLAAALGVARELADSSEKTVPQSVYSYLFAAGRRFPA